MNNFKRLFHTELQGGDIRGELRAVFLRFELNIVNDIEHLLSVLDDTFYIVHGFTNLILHGQSVDNRLIHRSFKLVFR